MCLVGEFGNGKQIDSMGNRYRHKREGRDSHLIRYSTHSTRYSKWKLNSCWVTFSSPKSNQTKSADSNTICSRIHTQWVSLYLRAQRVWDRIRSCGERNRKTQKGRKWNRESDEQINWLTQLCCCHCMSSSSIAREPMNCMPRQLKMFLREWKKSKLGYIRSSICSNSIQFIQKEKAGKRWRLKKRLSSF